MKVKSTMKILLAGPGTGKTTNIKSIISDHGDGSKFLVLSFTNATVKDLQESLEEQAITNSNCMTLHKFAVKYNHDNSRHVLLRKETDELKQISKRTEIAFDELCDFLKCTTFDQMIERFVEYAQANPLYLQQKLSNYDSIIIDEYQDFNPSEQKLIDILIEKIQITYILGDDDQCIYDFKDASSDKIISFHADSNNEIIPHEHICYRCPDKIVDHATNLIKNNKKRVVKEWNKSGKIGDITHLQLMSFEDVSNDILDKIQNLSEEKILILSPVGFAIEPLIKKFEEHGVEYTNCFSERISGDLITKSWEVKSLFGDFRYLNLVLLGYINLTNRKKLYELIKKHFDEGESFNELYTFLENKLPERIKNNEIILDDFLSLDYYADVYELYKMAQGNMPEIKLENIFREIDEKEEKNIQVMSIHKSKGLGVDHVFIVGLNEGIIPNKKRGNDSIESQRRLFYVGITRTKKQLFLYSNIQIEGKHVNKVNKDDFNYNYISKIWNGKSSSFISELKLN